MKYLVLGKKNRVIVVRDRGKSTEERLSEWTFIAEIEARTKKEAQIKFNNSIK